MSGYCMEACGRVDGDTSEVAWSCGDDETDSWQDLGKIALMLAPPPRTPTVRHAVRVGSQHQGAFAARFRASGVLRRQAVATIALSGQHHIYT